MNINEVCPFYRMLSVYRRRIDTTVYIYTDNAEFKQQNYCKLKSQVGLNELICICLQSA